MSPRRYAMAASHFLNDSWCLYFHDPNDTHWGKTSFVRITDMSSIETFWGVHGIMSSKLHLGMFFLMREGIFPLWEEPDNRQGGYLSLKIPKNRVAHVWTELCGLVLGEVILREPARTEKWNQINGISVSPKKSFSIIKIWLRSKDMRDAALYQLPPHADCSDVLFKAYDEEEAVPPPFLSN